jgi:ABC-type glycerol-3-phosphate transport system substrate-binding protein
MKPVNRQVSFAGVMALVALIAVQCASPDALVEPTAATSIELTYITLFFDEPPFDAVEQVLIDQFEAAYPNIKVSRSSVSVFDSSPKELLTASSPPDIMATEADRSLISAIDRGLILDISDMWRQSELDDAHPASFRALGERGGKQYFLPAFHTWAAVYYNKRIFDQYNLEPPNTWDEFLTVSGILLANDVTPIALGWYDLDGATWWLDYLDMRLNGPEFHAELVWGRERYDVPRIREVFETFKFLLDNGYFEEEAGALRLTQSLNLVHEGKAAMILCDSSLVGDLPEKFQEELGFFPFPIIDPGLPVGEVASTFGYFIPAGAPHPLEAMEFLAYLGSVEVQTAMAQQYGRNAGILPVHRGVDTTNFAPKAKQGVALVQGADHIGQPYIFSFVPGEGMSYPTVYFAFSRFFRDTEGVDIIMDALEEERQRSLEE